MYINYIKIVIKNSKFLHRNKITLWYYSTKINYDIFFKSPRKFLDEAPKKLGVFGRKPIV